jgi:hypothetical protein
VPAKDPEHWLYRLDAAEWLAAAENELRMAYQALGAKHRREGLTYARRAGGMALNGLLWRDEARLASYGRSYVDHLRALAADAGAPEAARTAAGRLMAARMQVELVALGPGPVDLADDAAAVVGWARTSLA